jgi:N-acetylneuraminic acid mutarotase
MRKPRSLLVATVTALLMMLAGQPAFAASAQEFVTLTGRVTDGSGHGWPLYARLTFPGGPGNGAFTNPVTGEYSVPVPADTTVRLTVEARYPGYRSVVREVAVGDVDLRQDVALPVDTDACVAPGYAPRLSAPLVSESFDAPTTPAGWTVVDRTGKGGWAFNDPGNRGNLTGGTGGFAIADSDAAGSGSVTDTDLVTPVFDLTGAATPLLRFNSDYRDLGADDSGEVDVTTDGGATWRTVWQATTSRRGPRVEEVALTAVANQASVQLRFRYRGTWDWWWQVDNVSVVNRTCEAVPGGLVVGFTTDATTGQPLNGVTVSSVERPTERGVSAPTPEDGNLPDGFYWLFSSLTGPRVFEASRAPYQAARLTVNVVPDAVTRADAALTSARIVVTPAGIESYQTLGQTRTTTLTVRNTGTAAADVELIERNGTFTVLTAAAPTLRTVKIDCLNPRSFTANRCVTGDATPPGAAAPPWENVKPYPTAISDNAAASDGGVVYSVGGGSGTGQERRLYAYDRGTDTWLERAQAPRARSKPQAALLGGKLYVFGGWATGGDPVAEVDVYDPATNAWTTLAATNPRPRAAAGVAVTGGRVHLVGGCTNANCDTSVDHVVFDSASGTFGTGPAYPQPVAWLSCGGIGAEVYCAGGSDDASYRNGFAFDAGGGAWRPIKEAPMDFWGAQEATANGRLIVVGGVSDGSTAITNRAIAYDPAGDTWTELPSANQARARGAGACGFYRIGGWSGPFAPSADVERLPGYDRCEQITEAPWLGAKPGTFRLEPGQRVTVTVTLTATPEAGVAQPGTYTAQILLRVASPYPVAPVTVTMHVLPPGAWGKIQGTVTGQTCAGATVPVPAYVSIASVANPDLTYPVQAGADGRYQIWLPQGRYELIVSRDGWAPQVRRVKVEAGFVGEADFTLRPFRGCGPRVGGV